MSIFNAKLGNIPLIVALFNFAERSLYSLSLFVFESVCLLSLFVCLATALAEAIQTFIFEGTLYFIWASTNIFWSEKYFLTIFLHNILGTDI